MTRTWRLETEVLNLRFTILLSLLYFQEEFIQSEKDTIEPSPFTFSKPRVLHPSSDPPSAGTSNKKLIIPSTKKPADTESSTQASVSSSSDD